MGLRAVSVMRGEVASSGAPDVVMDPTLPGGNAEFGPLIKNSASKERSVSDHPENVSVIVARVPAVTMLRSRFCICDAHCVNSASSPNVNAHPVFVLNRMASWVPNGDGDSAACSPDNKHAHIAGTDSHTIEPLLLLYTDETLAMNATSKHTVITRSGQFSNFAF
jgi:hypothetical protein